MLKFKRDSFNKTEAKLLQAKSMATILLDNINYKCHGLSEPTISENDAGNLAWVLIDLIDESLDELCNCEPCGGDNHA